MGEGQDAGAADRSGSGGAERLVARLGRNLSLRCALDTGKGFPSGSACAVRAARSSVRGRWNGRNRRRKCPRRAEGYRRRDIAPPRDAREKRSNEPSCTQFRRGVVTGSIVRKDPLPRIVEQWEELVSIWKKQTRKDSMRGRGDLLQARVNANCLTFCRERLLSAFWDSIWID